MSDRQRHALMIAAVVLISLTLLAAPARGADWWGVHIGSDGFGLSAGSTDWAAWGPSWQDPSWSVDYHVALAGYGEWVWVDGLGQCWLPWVTPNWRPFTYGRWVWTAFGWTWVAYEPWGYFPHHFGNWAMAPVGWVWVPGTTYHAANVVWVSSDAWVGWYPAPPLAWHHHGHHDGHYGGWDGGWNDVRYATFVGWHDLGCDDLSERALGADAVRARTPRAVLRDGAAAPSRDELGRRGVAIPEMNLERRTARVAGREVVLARPREAAAAIERNAGRTVERALAAPAAATARTASRGATVASALPRGDSRGVLAPGAGTTATATRTRAPAAVVEPRSAAAAAPPAAASRHGSGERGDERGTAVRSTAPARARSDERARRSEAERDDVKAVAPPSPHRRR